MTNSTSALSAKDQLAALLPRVLRFALSLTRDQGSAEDLVQTAYAKAVEHLDQFEDGTRLDSWLFRIIQNSWIDEKRRLQRTDNVVSLEEASETGLPAHNQGSSDRVFLQKALAALPTDQRAALSLVLVDGYSYREAGEMLGIPDGTVMSRVARARKHLVSLYNAEGKTVFGNLQRGSS
jgi:RNA polymerase sigma-70 factor (ECF subfamily)